MKNRTIFAVFSVLIVVNFACSKNNPLATDQTEKLVVLSEINQLDSASVNLSQAKAGFPFVADAEVKITSLADRKVENFVYQNRGNYKGQQPKAGFGYRLSVFSMGKIVEAEQIMPQSFTLDAVTDGPSALKIELEQVHAGEHFYTIELLANHYNVQRFVRVNNEVIEVASEEELKAWLSKHGSAKVFRDTTFSDKQSRLIISTDDVRTENVKYNELKDLSGRIFIKHSNTGKLTLAMKCNLADSSKFTLVVKSVTPAYFKYLYASDLQFVNKVFGVLNIPLEGNVNGALGIFGAAYVKRIPIKF
ncbi:MAG: DUF4249 family protein [Sphingobacteriaceae bacterium]|nr:DUF4249 family protein [Sphingobacteriaceae bacterium]